MATERIQAVDVVLLQRAPPTRAPRPLPLPLGMHDAGLALAARAFGFEVLGA